MMYCCSSQAGNASTTSRSNFKRCHRMIVPVRVLFLFFLLNSLTAANLHAAGKPALPAAPSSLSATAASSSQINLSWTDNSSNESGFKVERCAGSGCTSFAQVATVGANVTSCSDTGLGSAATYSYRVKAWNSTGDSGYSNTSSATTQDTPPAAPSNLTATAASSSQINLAWTDNSSNETGFKIERCAGRDRKGVA